MDLIKNGLGFLVYGNENLLCLKNELLNGVDLLRADNDAIIFV